MELSPSIWPLWHFCYHLLLWDKYGTPLDPSFRHLLGHVEMLKRRIFPTISAFEWPENNLLLSLKTCPQILILHVLPSPPISILLTLHRTATQGHFFFHPVMKACPVREGVERLRCRRQKCHGLLGNRNGKLLSDILALGVFTHSSRATSCPSR